MNVSTVGPANTESSKPVSHLAWIDWLRFLAALMVVIGHTRFQHFAYYDLLVR